MRREREEAQGLVNRASILPAFVEVMLAAGDIAAAEQGAEELTAAAAALQAPYLRALAAYAKGSVQLASGEHRQALDSFRAAVALWRLHRVTRYECDSVALSQERVDIVALDGMNLPAAEEVRSERRRNASQRWVLRFPGIGLFVEPLYARANVRRLVYRLVENVVGGDDANARK